ncbi:MAG: cupin domain-containing protein [Gammaproteobacteria bacterium]|jgi:quercetin dioxygenase-like cupin family protein|nr:cupin domain-containing protein [Gammaproteobacteria bacterium]MBU0827301.1 cupin domain-containing protein [Gammaproteobacteria bacterium]MBU0892678.1 cupin domain-containing protein [Gammaproteobacteria bacterium]MBU1351564.1 cupin domain-containing protein [Gammaproteobacteria bacterium]MBU1815749.1 cupin domain-containing protein [Gammaproteobacteria bacterium]
MALPHAQSGQIVSVRPLGDRLAQTVTTAILKAGQLEVMRVVLPVGKSMKEHQTPGEATVQCIEGMVEFVSDQGVQQLRAGDFVHLAPRALHALKAVEPASLLVTLCLKPADAA